MVNDTFINTKIKTGEIFTGYTLGVNVFGILMQAILMVKISNVIHALLR